jgi:hypothetical protein
MVRTAGFHPANRSSILRGVTESIRFPQIAQELKADRVCVNRGRGQLYGTQFTQEDGKHIPRTIEDEANIDARRAEVGMGPLSEQIELMYQKYPMGDEK